jgi:hypothetical protein
MMVYPLLFILTKSGICSKNEGHPAKMEYYKQNEQRFWGRKLCIIDEM